MQSTIKVKGHLSTIGGKVVWVAEHERHIEHAVGDDFDAFVAQHDVKPIAVPKPPTEAPASQPQAFDPNEQDPEMSWIGHNQQPGHNKIYKTAVFRTAEGGGLIVSQFGKAGGTLKQVVHPYSKFAAAVKDFKALVSAKQGKGYGAAGQDQEGYAISVPWEKVHGMGTAPQPEAPKAAPEPVAAPPAKAPEPAAAPEPKTALPAATSMEEDFSAFVDEHGIKPLLPGTPKVGEHVPFDNLKPGMILERLKNETDGVSPVMVEILGGESFGTKIAFHYHGGQINHHIWTKESYTNTANSSGIAAMDKFVLVAENPKIGDTKTINGYTYEFNSNHRWELKQGPGVEPQPQEGEIAAQPAPKAAPQPAAQPGKSLADKSEARTPMHYQGEGGEVAVWWTMSGVIPELRIKGKLNAATEQALTKLGANFMPVKKEWKIALNGKPWASGKAKAQAVHEALLLHVGPVVSSEEKQKSDGEKAKALAAFTAELSGTWIALDHGSSAVLSNGVVIGKGKQQQVATIRVFQKKEDGSVLPHEIQANLAALGFKVNASSVNINGPYLWINTKGHSADTLKTVAPYLFADGKAPMVGDTKVEGGKTYQLNANHRWVLVEKPKPATAAAPTPKPATPAAPAPAPVPMKLPESFPFKQIGPQAGSNPGGLFEDSYGKKWYVKFPATEDHAKNELLAAKLYAMAGIAGPKVKLVKKDGKVGIASRFQEGLKQGSAAVLAAAPGALDGFGMDAWLGNWDAVGLDNDNLLLDAEGHAVRIDGGGSLIYRAQGAPKGEAFGTAVHEVDTLRDAKTNPKTAAVFGKMTPEELDASIARVLEIPDDVIEQVVAKFGPGDEAAKKALADKLIARKAYLAKRFPGANLIANPPAPDPSKIPVKADDFPKAPDFLNWNGGGKGLSGNEEINKQNQEAASKIYALATAGNLTALKALTFVPVGDTNPHSMAEHKSQHIRAMFHQCVATLESLADPNNKKAKNWLSFTFEGTLDEVSEAFPAYHYGVTKTNIDQKKRVGYWLHLGTVEGAETLIPHNIHNVTDAESAAASKANKTMPSIVRQFMQDVKDSGSANEPYRQGKEFDHAHNKCRDVIALAYEHAVPFEEGAVIRRQQSETHEDKGMTQKLLSMKPGDLLQNPGSMCCSKIPEWNWGGQMDLEIVMAKGAQALYNIGVGSHNHEGEITTLPGQRFVLLERKEKGPKGTPWFRLLALPPDPTYLQNLKAPKEGAA